MIHPGHLLFQVINPVLRSMDAWDTRAERLVLGTAVQESECGYYLHQLGDGPALGIYQMEPATHDDCWKNYLQYQPKLAAKVKGWTKVAWAGLNPGVVPDAKEMLWNLAYATAMCRVKYLRVAEEIPDTLPEQAAYYKKYYNTPQGAGTETEYIHAWQRIVGSTISDV